MVEVLVEFEYTAAEEDELSLKAGEVVSDVIKHDGGWWEGTYNGKKGMFPDNFVKEIKIEKTKDVPRKAPLTTQVSQGSHVAEMANKLGNQGIKMGPAPQKAAQASIKREKSTSSEGLQRKVRARAAHSYQPQNDDELELKVGDLITVTNQEEEGWWEGTVGDKSGVFPSNFVEILKPEEDGDQQQADGDFHEIQGKKIKGIGFGNIFAGGPVKLKGAKKTENIEKEPNQPAQETKPRKNAPPPVPKDPPAVTAKEKPVKKAKILYSYNAENSDELSLTEGQVVNVLEVELEDSGWWKGEIDGKSGVFPDNFVELLPDEPKPKRPAPPAAPSSNIKSNKAHSPAHTKHKKEETKAASTTVKAPLPKKTSNPPPLSKKPGKTDPKLIAQTDDHKVKEKSENNLDAVEATETLNHPTANRAKAPVRRPPSTRDKEAVVEEPFEDIPEITTPRGSKPRGSRFKRAQPPLPPVEPVIEEPEVEEKEPEPEVMTAPDEQVEAELEDEEVHVPKLPAARQSRPLPSPSENTPSSPRRSKPVRPPSPAQRPKSTEVVNGLSSTASAEIELLREELAELKANSVSRADYEELQEQVVQLRDMQEKMRTQFSKLIQDVTDELDEEKKIRLSTEVEIKRIKKLVQS